MSTVIRQRRSPEIIPVPLCDMPEALTVCASLDCGGLLAYLAGTWQHVEACLDCYDQNDGPCPHRWQHRACDDPQPKICCHDASSWHCQEPVSILGVPCVAGRENLACCGCCYATDDDLEGRALWPLHLDRDEEGPTWPYEPWNL